MVFRRIGVLGAVLLASCSDRPDLWPLTAIDCDAQFFADRDGDGYGDDAMPLCDVPGAVPVGGDCDDTRPYVHPGAVEACDGRQLDEDCDGVPGAHYVDEDGDGWGDVPANTLARCAGPIATLGGDCDDGDARVHPDAPEICGDGVDQDCDGSAWPCGWDAEMDPEDATGETAMVVAARDIDGDGQTDALTFDGTRWALVAGPIAGGRVLRSGDVGTFLGGAIGDFDGDGTEDVAIGGADDDDEAEILVRGSEDQTWAGSVWRDAPGDVDGDGRDEILVSLTKGAARVEGVQADLRSNVVTRYLDTWYAYGAGDVDGDGWDDVVTSGTDATPWLLYGAETGDLAPEDATAAWSRPATTLEDTHPTFDVSRAGDLDGDGRDDLALHARWRVEQGGEMYDHEAAWILTSPVGGDPDALAALALPGAPRPVGDVDGDGFPDVVTYEVGSTAGGDPFQMATLAWGPTFDHDEVVFGRPVNWRIGQTAQRFDVDGDGAVDLVLGALEPYPSARSWWFTVPSGGL